MKSSLVSLAAVLLVSSALFGQEQGDKEEKLPRSGVLSRSMSAGYQSKNVELPWGSSKSGISEQGPITGSVSRQGADAWVMRLFNNSNETYSVSVRVVQRNGSGTQTKTDFFSYTLKGNETAERVVSDAPGTVDAQLVLDRWRNLSPTPAPTAQARTPTLTPQKTAPEPKKGRPAETGAKQP